MVPCENNLQWIVSFPYTYLEYSSQWRELWKDTNRTNFSYQSKPTPPLPMRIAVPICMKTTQHEDCSMQGLATGFPIISLVLEVSINNWSYITPHLWSGDRSFLWCELTKKPSVSGNLLHQVESVTIHYWKREGTVPWWVAVTSPPPGTEIEGTVVGYGYKSHKAQLFLKKYMTPHPR